MKFGGRLNLIFIIVLAALICAGLSFSQALAEHRPDVQGSSPMLHHRWPTKHGIQPPSDIAWWSDVCTYYYPMGYYSVRVRNVPCIVAVNLGKYEGLYLTLFNGSEIYDSEKIDGDLVAVRMPKEPGHYKIAVTWENGTIVTIIGDEDFSVNSLEVEALPYRGDEFKVIYPRSLMVRLKIIVHGNMPATIRRIVFEELDENGQTISTHEFKYYLWSGIRPFLVPPSNAPKRVYDRSIYVISFPGPSSNAKTVRVVVEEMYNNLTAETSFNLS